MTPRRPTTRSPSSASRAAAEAWRDAGEVLASGLGLVPRLAAGLAQLTFSPDLLMTDAEALLVAEPVPVGTRGGYRLQVEGWMPFRKVFDVLWSGRRHAMTMPTQIDRFGQINISCIGGDFAKPKVQLLGVRGIPGNTINHPCSFFVADHSTAELRRARRHGVGRRLRPGALAAGRAARLPRLRLRRDEPRRARLRRPGARDARSARCIPASRVEQVEEQTSFPLARAADLHETPTPTAEQLRLIRDVLDPARPAGDRLQIGEPRRVRAHHVADRIAEVVLDHPPVNALRQRRLARSSRRPITALGRDDARERRAARRRGPRLLRRRRHQGARARRAR